MPEDVVCLKSGSAFMIVMSIEEADDGVKYATCTHQKEGVMRTDSFPVAYLYRPDFVSFRNGNTHIEFEQ